MTSLFDKLMALDVKKSQKAPEPEFEPEEKAPLVFGSREPVKFSRDLDRILKLPRRPADYELIAQAEATRTPSDSLRRPGGTRNLRPIQAAALIEARAVRGLLAPIGVGEGKTDISVLLPTVLGAKVAVLLVPPALKKKLVDVEYPYLRTQWRLPNLAGSKVIYPDTTAILHVVSYSQLSTAKGTDLLDELKPDLIVADEVHSLAGSSARRKRFERYMKANQHVLFCGMSGTITSKSIKEYSHLAKYAFHDGSPLPLHWPTLDEWSAVLDPKMDNPPGALVQLCRPGEDVRSGFGRRVVETPGVVASKGDRPPTALTFHERPIKTPAGVEELLSNLRGTWDAPDGEALTDALSVHRYGCQLAAGLYTEWVWPPVVPESLKDEWLDCRREWHKEVREMLKGDAKAGMDSPLLLARAAIKGKWSSLAFEPWRRVAGQYRTLTGHRTPETRTVWVDDFLVNDAVEWGRKAPGIIWYSHADLGRRLAEAGGFQLYGAASTAPTAEDNMPAIVKEKGDRTIVASIHAWGTGWNLQQFSRQLYTTTPTSAKLLEQAIGRCHRSGQEADEVECFFYRHTPEMVGALTAARRDAIYIESTMKTSQRCLYGTYTFPLPL